jgi:very-short-patch-repair endonuclease
MERYFIKVIRFTNSEIEKNIEDVVKRIENEVTGRMESFA